jgi:MFS family permease
VLTDWLGWQWIFFINVPVGAIGFVLALRFVPVLETHSHRFDWLGVALSGAGMFLLVFGIQEGQQKHWAGWIIAFIVGGVAVIALFLVWQRFNRNEPLVPLGLFADRNYSVANVVISIMGRIFTGMGFPLILYAEAARGDSPVKAALLLLPMAVMALVFAKPAGDLTDRLHPRIVIGTGTALNAIAFFWLSLEMKDGTNIWLLILPMALMGIGGAFIWAPNTATATRNLPLHQAGAGAGVYNATRQVGGAIGSAAMAALIDSRITALLGSGAAGGANADAGSSQLPVMLRAPFAKAMSESMLLPAIIGVVGFLVALLYARPRHAGFGDVPTAGH